MTSYREAPGCAFDQDCSETVVTRENAPKPVFSLMGEMFVERGTKADWDLLHDLHYKAENLPIGPRFWRLSLRGQTVGVLVTGNPKGLLRERHMAFPNIKPKGGDTKRQNTERYMWINQNIRVISRFVVDTMYRGIGAGYRMMNLVSRMEGVRIVEIQSAMSKYNQFGQKAGFTFIKPMHASKFEQGLKFFRSHFAASPQDYEALLEELRSKPVYEQEDLLHACKEFYYRHSALEKTGANREKGAERVAAMTDKAVIKAIQQITLASPMYGYYLNPDFKRAVPSRLPMTAYDWQKPNEPLNIPENFSV